MRDGSLRHQSRGPCSGGPAVAVKLHCIEASRWGVFNPNQLVQWRWQRVAVSDTLTALTWDKEVGSTCPPFSLGLAISLGQIAEGWKSYAEQGPQAGRG